MATVRELEEELRRLMKMGFIDYGTELAAIARPSGGYALGYASLPGQWAAVVPLADGMPAGHAADALLSEALAQIKAEDAAGVEA